MKISIITATYNSEKHIEHCIHGVISQTYNNIEYIIIDGLSSDHTLDIIRKYQDRVDVLVSEKDEGVYDAFNKGIRAASGDVIFFMNSDDYFVDEHVVSDIMKQFSDNSIIDFIYGNVINEDSNKDMTFISGKKIGLADLKKASMCHFVGFFAKKSLYVKHQLFDAEYKIVGDLDFVIKCFKDNEEAGTHTERLITVFRAGGISTNPLHSHHFNVEQEKVIEKHFGFEAAKPFRYRHIINTYYRMWIEKKILNNESIFNSLIQSGVTRIAIFGSLKTALMLYQEAREAGLTIVTVLDNSPHRTNQKFKEITINRTEWLNTNAKDIDCIVLSVESMFDEEVKVQLNDMINHTDIKVVSWKELVH